MNKVKLSILILIVALMVVPATLGVSSQDNISFEPNTQQSYKSLDGSAEFDISELGTDGCHWIFMDGDWILVCN